MAQPFIPDPNAQGYQDGIDTENSYYTTARANAAQVQQQAGLIAQQRAAAPGIPAGSYQSLATTGVDPNSPQFDVVSTDYLPSPQSNSVQYSMFDRMTNVARDAAAEVGGVARAAAKLPKPELTQLTEQAEVQAGKDALAPLRHSASEGFTWNPFHDIARVAQDAGGGVGSAAHWVGSALPDPVRAGLKIGTQWTAAAGSYGYEAVENLGGLITHPDPSKGVGERLEQALGSGTTLGQDIAHGTGSGILSTSPENASRLGHIQTQIRGASAAGGPETAGTGFVDATNMIGRTVFRHELIRPGTVSYGVVSGLADLVAAQKVDPANLAFNKWHAISEARGTFDLDPAARGAGLINGIRNAVNPTRFDDWSQQGKVQSAINDLAGMTSAGEIMDRTGFKLPIALAGKLADAQTPEEVSGLLRDAVGTEFKYVPTVSHFAGLGGTAYAVRSMMPRDPRWLEQMPERGINLANLDQGAKNLYLEGVEAKLPRSVLYARLDDFAKVAASDNASAVGPGAYNAVVNGLNSDIERKLAGNAWFGGVDARGLADNIFTARDDPTFLSTISDSLTHTFPSVKFTQQNFEDVAHLVSTSPDKEIGRGLVLDYLSGDGPVDASVADRAGVAALGKSHMSPEAARYLTTSWRGADTSLKARWFDMSRPGNLGHIMVRDEMQPIQGPFSVNESLQNYIPLPDARRLREATTTLPNILSALPGDHIFNPYLTESGRRRLWLAAAEGTNSLWKRSVTLTRPATLLRILANEQFAAATDGTASAFSHPFRTIANVIAGHSPTGDIDMLDHPFIDGLNDRSSAFAQAASITNNPLSDHPDRIYLRAHGEISADSRDPRVYRDAWGKEVAARSTEPIDSKVAQALAEPTETEQQAALDELKRGFWGTPRQPVTVSDAEIQPGDRFGNVSNFRKGLLAGASGDAHDWRPELANRTGSDNYIDAVADRVTKTTGGDPALLEAIGHQTFNGEPITKALADGKGNLSRPFLDHLAALHENNVGPQLVRGRLSALSADGRGQVGAALDQATDWLFDHTMGIPSQTLMRGPAFSDAYGKEALRLAPAMDDEARQAAAKLLGVDVNSLPARVDRASYLTTQEADLLSKNAALDKVKTLFYDAHAQSNFTDAMRIISPFAEVFRQEVKRWATIGPANFPKIVRRLGQLNGTLRDSHLIAPDPVTGKESVHIPITGWEQQAAGALATAESAASVPFGGSFENSLGGPTVANASLSVDPSKAFFIAQGMPGIGAVASVPMDEILRRIPGADSIRQALLPYGGTDTTQGVGNAALATFTPTWLKSVLNAGLGAGAQRNATVMADTMSYLQSARPQDYPTTSAGRQKLINDADEISHKLWIVKGIAQAILPAPPSLHEQTKTNQGWVELEQLAKDWNTSLDTAYGTGGNSADATREFIDRYGPSAGLAMVNQTLPRIYGLTATDGMSQWRDAHPDLVQKYPDVWPFLVPGANGTSDKGKSYLAVQKQIGDDERTTLDPRQRMELADFRLGQFVYDRYRGMLPANPNKVQSAWLDQVRAQVGNRYPGWASNDGQFPADIAQKANHDAVIGKQMSKFVDDPALADSPIAQGTAAYLQFRNEALVSLGASKKAAPSQSLQAKDAVQVRAWLGNAAEAVLRKYPAFAPVWESFFQPEIAPANG